MKLPELLLNRSENKCELCGATDSLQVYEVPPQDQTNAENCIMVCNTCLAQIDKKAELNQEHWKCLNESM